MIETIVLVHYYKLLLIMNASDGKLIFIGIILIFAIVIVIHQCCEFFGCTDLCKRREDRNVIQVQQLPPELPIVAAEIQRDEPELTVVAFEVKGSESTKTGISLL